MMTTEQYEQYLESEAWKQKARERLKIDNYKCCMCETTGTAINSLQVHHLTYRRLGYEDVNKDVLTLCKSCHYSVHKMMNRPTGQNRRGWKDELSYTQHINRALEQSKLMAEANV